MKAKRSLEESRKEMEQKLLEALWALNSASVRASELGEDGLADKLGEMKAEISNIAESMGFN